MDATWLLLGVFVILHGATFVVAVGIYRAQMAYFRHADGKIEAAIRDVKAEIPDLAGIEARIKAEITAAKPPPVDLAGIEARIKAALPPPLDVDDLENRVSARLMKAIDGKLGAVGRDLDHDLTSNPDVIAAVQAKIDQAGGSDSVGGNLVLKIMNGLADSLLERFG